MERNFAFVMLLAAVVLSGCIGGPADVPANGSGEGAETPPPGQDAAPVGGADNDNAGEDASGIGGMLSYDPNVPQKCIISSKDGLFALTYHMDGTENMRIEGNVGGQELTQIVKDGYTYMKLQNEMQLGGCEWIKISSSEGSGSESGDAGLGAQMDVPDIESMQEMASQFSVSCTPQPMPAGALDVAGKVCSIEELYSGAGVGDSPCAYIDDPLERLECERMFAQ